MEKEYVSARLFKNHRSADGLITNEELFDSDLQQSTETLNSSNENTTVESNTNSNQSSLPQRLLSVVKKALAGQEQKN